MTYSASAETNQPAAEGLSDSAYSAMTVIDGKCFLRDAGRWIAGTDGIPAGYPAQLRASGLTAISTTLGGSVSYAETVGQIAAVDAAIVACPEGLLKVGTSLDIVEAKRSGRVGVIYDLQGTTELGSDASRVASLAKAGVRVFQLTYNRAALVGDGCLEPRNAGLSEFGREVIAAVEAEKCLVDLSHAGRRTTLEAIAAAKRPCAVTHTGCNGVNEHPRNIDDDAIRAIAEGGGVVGIYFMSYLRRSGQCDSGDVIAHIEHAVDVAGEEHVSIGTDGDVGPLVLDEAYREHWRTEVVEPRIRAGIAAPNEGADIFNYVPEYNAANRLQRLGGDLLRRGHSLSRVERILGGNLMRLFEAVWP